MKKFKRIRRAAACGLACVVFVLFSANAYLQASEEPQTGGAILGTADSDGTESDAGRETELSGAELSGTEPGTEGQTAEAQTDSAQQTEQESAPEDAQQTEAESTAQTAEQTEPELMSETAGQTETETASETTGQTEAETASESAGQTETETTAETDALPQTNGGTETPPESLPETETEEDTETEAMLEEVLEEAQRQGVDFFGLAPGESLTFYAPISEEDGIMTIAAKVTAVTVTRADQPYKYADYGYGTFQTYKYTVTFNDITATAYCIQPSSGTPGSSNSYTVKRMKGAKLLAKVCYYGTKAAGADGFFATTHPDFSEGQKFIITHLAAALANESPDAFAGANEKAQKLARELYDYCAAQPDIPDVDMEFSEASVAAYADAGTPPSTQRTGAVTFLADSAQSVTFTLPAGVVLHDLSTGTDSTPGGSITITGGTTFYLSAPISQALSTGEVWSTTLYGSLTKDYSAYKIYTGAATQNLALVFGDGVDSEASANFSVRWLKPINLAISKTDAETGKGLAGVTFKLCADAGGQTVLANFPATDAQGETSAIVYRTQDDAYLVEEKERAGYVHNTQAQPVSLGALEAAGQGSFSFTNRRITASLHLTKKDAETGTAQGDAVLKGAVYGLYARSDIVHPDGSTGVLFRAGEQVATMTTDANGKASLERLYLGQYYVKEISPSTGYLIDEKEYDITFEASDGSVAVIEKECTSGETVIRQPFQLIKISGNRKTDSDLLAGAGFTAYLVSSLSRKEDGSYDFTSAKPVALGTGGETEIFTDKDGYAVSAALPFGTYVVRETTIPPGHTPVADFEVRITENNPTKPQVWRVLVDKEFEAKLKIVKSDDETHQNVLAANTEFKVYDLDAGKYVEQVTTYPKEVKHSSYFTDEEGSLILPNTLPRGHYQIEEVTAPDGYTVEKTPVQVNVDSNVAYRMNESTNEAIIEVVASNHPVKGELRVVKKGEILKGYKDDFLYEETPLAGAVYEVYAAENIYTADLQKDAEGNRTLEYAEGAKVGELTTEENGEGVMRDLPLGKYRVVEKTAPEGFVLNKEEQYAQFVYVDQDTPVVTVELTFVNERQKVEITAVKKDAENEALLAGAEFGLFAKEEIKAGEETVVEAGTQLATAETGNDGRAVFAQELPFGSYYVRELRAPAGYLPSEETVELVASYEGQEKAAVQLESAFADKPMIVEFTKSDLTTGAELDGATLSVLDQDGNVVDSWVSEKGNPHRIRCLHVGETYVLREEFAPYGYLRAEEVKFTVEGTEEPQKVKMKDAAPVGRIIISKTGEFVGSVTWNQMVTGTLESVFGYVSGSLREVVFEVYAAEDIRAADGVSANYYHKDELVATITTDALGYARAEDLPLGKYYVVEKKTAEGFVLDDQPREIDLTYRDQDTPVVTYDEKWQNSRQKVRVTVQKKEKGSGRPLEGGVFALCARTDIAGADGNVLLKAGAVIEQRATDADGGLVFAADLPVGGSYYVKEVKAPAGYVTSDELKEFTFAYAGEQTKEVSFDFVFKDKPTKVRISKTDITSGKELPGAKLELRDAQGNVVDRWTSKTKPHMIRGLEAGKVYTLREESAPDGYVVAEEIRFKVGDTGKVQKVTMKDERAPAKTEEAPKTGDDTDLFLPEMAMAMSGFLVLTLASVRRRKKRLS